MAKENVDINNIILEVLESNSDFGKEMRGKISAIFDKASKDISEKLDKVDVESGKTNVPSLMGVSKADQDKTSKTFSASQKKINDHVKKVALSENFKDVKEGVGVADIMGATKQQKKSSYNKLITQQNHILEQIKLAAKKSNFTQLKMGVNITDILGVDKIKAKAIQSEFNTVQKKFISALKGNIPTKDIPLSDAAKSPALNKRELDLPEPTEEEALKGVPAFGDIGKIEGVFSGMDQKLGNIDDNTRAILLPDVKGATEGGDIKEGEFKGDKSKVIETQSETNSLIETLLEKIDIMNKSQGDAGDEEFIDRPQNVIVIDISNDVIKKISEAMPETKKDEKIIDTKKSGFIKTLLKVAGITALLGFITFLAKNPEKWEKLKGIFKEKLIPMFKKIPEYLEILGGTIWNMIEISIKLFKDAKDWMKDKFWPAIFATWDWIVEKFTDAQNWMKDKFWPAILGAWDWVVEKFTGFGKAIGEGAALIYDKILELPDIIGDMIEKVKGYINDWLDKTIPGRAKRREEREEAIRQQTQVPERSKAQIEKFESTLGRSLTEVERSAVIKTVGKGSTGRTNEEELALENLKLSSKEAMNANIVVNPNQKEHKDFIWRPGEAPQSFSGSDVVIGAKDKIIVENKNMDEQMHNLTSIMKGIQDRFDTLLGINTKIADTNASGVRSNIEPLPPIPESIETFRGVASEEFKHRMGVWGFLNRT